MYRSETTVPGSLFQLGLQSGHFLGASLGFELPFGEPAKKIDPIQVGLHTFASQAFVAPQEFFVGFGFVQA